MDKSPSLENNESSGTSEIEITNLGKTNFYCQRKHDIWQTIKNCFCNVINKPYFKNPYKLENIARSIKIILQMSVGLFIVISIPLYICTIGRSINFYPKLFWKEFDGNYLKDMIADCLLISTAIELAYMFYTEGIDEAINPPITAISAVILLKLPLDSNTYSNGVNGFWQAGEIALYILFLIVFLVLKFIYDNNHKQNSRNGNPMVDR